jgi:hypothetical protein
VIALIAALLDFDGVSKDKREAVGRTNPERQPIFCTLYFTSKTRMGFKKCFAVIWRFSRNCGASQ